jgi:AAA15 family ATPase/GTPase
MEKSIQGTSSLFSLKNFEKRYDKSISKAYLAGRYGAVPYFESLPNERTANELI